MNVATAQTRYRAVSMELAAYLDGHYVEMRIHTDTGQAISIVCPWNSIFSVQRHIERMGRDCPEIATWAPATTIDALACDGRGSRKLTRSASLSIPGRHRLRTAGYVFAALICLAAGPAAFMAVDHEVVVYWSNKILDLVSS